MNRYKINYSYAGELSLMPYYETIHAVDETEARRFFFSNHEGAKLFINNIEFICKL